MASHRRNKLTADICSPESLSFAGLVEDQQPKKFPPKHIKANKKQSPEFEFVSIATNPTGAANSTKSTPADVLISNGILQPQALVKNPPIPLASFLETHSRPDEHFGSKKKHGQQAPGKEDKQRTSWFGEKMFKSIMSPCRKCKVIQPGDVKAQNAARQHARVY
ncbi:hypothetical protein L6164_036705 [Bauhinia variegata]|uniref:Uncharacterized protein n=1 Tax=Bauhinia variegata TaxID=167791 RepID=A0ACB9KI26_BAUVA|nr:hypothetical protein L6164_036705 [Bauhinia variegata]